MTGDRTLEQIELLNDELADIDRQVLDGDIDEATAEELRARYTDELDALIRSRGSESLDDGGDSESQGRLTKRAVAGIVVVGVAVVAIAVFAVMSLTGSAGSGVEGVAGDVLNGDGARDLSTVTNEEMESVIAANPDVVPMRLALVREPLTLGFDGVHAIVQRRSLLVVLLLAWGG